jgi:hypothetical protein
MLLKAASEVAEATSVAGRIIMKSFFLRILIHFYESQLRISGASRRLSLNKNPLCI